MLGALPCIALINSFEPLPDSEVVIITIILILQREKKESSLIWDFNFYLASLFLDSHSREKAGMGSGVGEVVVSLSQFSGETEKSSDLPVIAHPG